MGNFPLVTARAREGEWARAAGRETPPLRRPSKQVGPRSTGCKRRLAAKDPCWFKRSTRRFSNACRRAEYRERRPASIAGSVYIRLDTMLTVSASTMTLKKNETRPCTVASRRSVWLVI